MDYLNKIICHDVMKPWPLPDGCVQTVVTSPPYWGLRDYSVEGQIGLEKTPEEYIEKMVQVFRECWRVLRDDGTVWLNLGDSYASGKGKCHNPGGNTSSFNVHLKAANVHPLDRGNKSTLAAQGLKPKDLIGIPWRVALALQGFAVIPFKSLSQWADWLAEAIALKDWEMVQMVQQRIRLHSYLDALQDIGFYLRSDIIWSKPNPMPESVTDRPTKAHEYLFLLTKKPRYYYDADAIREPNLESSIKRDQNGYSAAFKGRHTTPGEKRPHSDTHNSFCNPSGRNRRSVWEIPTQPYPEAHFATFPEALVEPCIMAGSSEFGCCPDCGEPFTRVVEKVKSSDSTYATRGKTREQCGVEEKTAYNSGFKADGSSKTLGWKSQCKCNKQPVPCLVLDPFMGSGTVAKVALRAGRSFVGFDLSQEYIDMAMKRIGPILGQRRLI